MEVTGTVIEVFKEFATKNKTRRREFGVSYHEHGRNKQAKFTCRNEGVDLINFDKGQTITVIFTFEPWRNDNPKDLNKPFYNHELIVERIES